MKLRRSIGIIVFLALLVLPHGVPSFADQDLAAKQSGCVKPLFQQIIPSMKSRASEHWKREIAPIVEFLKSDRSDAEAVLNNKMLNRLPVPAKQALKKSYRCFDFAYCLAEKGIRTSFAPAFVLWDGVRIPPVMLGKTLMLARKSNRSVEKVKEILIMPAELIYKNVPYAVGYSAMTVAGYNVPSILRDRGTTFINELDQAVPPGEPFKKDELMVVVLPVGAAELAKKGSDFFVNQRTRYHQLDDSQVVTMTVSTPEEMLQKLGQLQKRGRIKEVVLTSHGSKGNFDLRSGGIEDIVQPWKWFDSRGEVNQKALGRLRPFVEEWPKDLFAEDARINLVSCQVAKSEKGTLFVKNLAGLVLQNGGTFIASPRSVLADPYTTRESESDLARIGNNDVMGMLLEHFVEVPIDFVRSGTEPGILISALTGGYSQDRVRVIRVAEPKK